MPAAWRSTEAGRRQIERATKAARTWTTMAHRAKDTPDGVSIGCRIYTWESAGARLWHLAPITLSDHDFIFGQGPELIPVAAANGDWVDVDPLGEVLEKPAE